MDQPQLAVSPEPVHKARNGAAGRRKGSVQDKVYAELRRRLMLGAFLPGQSVSLRRLADELGVSAMPVREAINHLIAEGGFEMLPNRSVQVPRMTRERLSELLAVRRALEGMAAEQACRRMSDRQLDRLEGLHRTAMRALENEDARRSLELNQRFHFALYSAARSSVMMPIIEALWLQAGPFMNLALTLPGVRWDGTHHTELLNALRRRDASEARNAIERDINKTADYLLGLGIPFLSGI